MKKKSIIIAALVLWTISLNAQINHRYPRLGIHQWRGAVDEWYAQFDLISTAILDVEWAKRIKSLNPDVVILPTSDWNAGTRIDPFPEEWYIRHADGSKIEYGGPGSYYANLSDICPPSSFYDGKRVCDYLPELLMQRVDLSVFDGIATDGLYYQDKELWNFHVVSKNLYWDTDLDANGVNDFDEHGEEWVVNHWNAGIDTIFKKLRRLMPANKLLMVNSGSWHFHHHNETNGVFLEHSYGGVTWNWFTDTYDEFMQTLRKPNTIFLDYDGDSKNEFRDMRFQLTTTLYGNAYFSYSDPGSHEHYYNKFYDEYLVDLGYPKEPAQEVASKGVWIRFFDHGVSIVNVSEAPQIILDTELKKLDGYDGPYFRFQGGQDPVHNNGELFDNITIWSGRDSTGTIGDGYLLLKSPQKIIYSIIIDNVDMGTSPSTAEPEFIGNWNQYPDPIEGNPYYTMRVADWFGMFAYTYASPGNGEARAIFRPTIGYAGYYEVFEWHCWHETSVDDEASNVPYTIKHHNGETMGTIDQTKNHGIWNSLGIFFFSTDTSGYMELTNNANGIVIADAVRFEFRGDSLTQEKPAFITINYPNGEEKLFCDSTYHISWDSRNCGDRVKIQFSTDGGSNWDQIANDTKNDGSYSWTTPSISSTTCMVKISAIDDSLVFDRSDSPFTIEIKTEGEVPGKLKLILFEHSKAEAGEDWTNAIDGDWSDSPSDWSGTVTAVGDSCYVVFGFSDANLHKINKIRLITDTGVGSWDYIKERWIKKFTVAASTMDQSENAFSTIVLDNVRKTGGNWQEYKFDPVSVKYLKLIINEPESGLRQIGEFEVYPVFSEDTVHVTRKLNLVLHEHSEAVSGEGWDNAIDNDWSDSEDDWSGTVTAYGDPCFAIFSFEDENIHTFNKIRLVTDTGIGDQKWIKNRWVQNFTVRISATDKAGTSFSTIVLDRVFKSGGDWQEYELDPTQARYIKLIIDFPDFDCRQLGEFEVYSNIEL